MTNTQIIEALVAQGVSEDLVAVVTEKLNSGSKSELSEKAKAVIDLLSLYPDDFFFAADIATELGIESKSITGVLTGLVNKNLLVKDTGDGGKKIYKIA